MQTIIVLLNPGKLNNPDLDLCYCVPDRIEEVSHGEIQDNGYDFIDAEDGAPGPLMGIWPTFPKKTPMIWKTVPMCSRNTI